MMSEFDCASGAPFWLDSLTRKSFYRGYYGDTNLAEKGTEAANRNYLYTRSPLGTPGEPTRAAFERAMDFYLKFGSLAAESVLDHEAFLRELLIQAASGESALARAE